MKLLNTKKWRQAEKGNVLFLILIAVALFAALSYAVTQSTRTGGGSGDNETALISSAQLTQYPASIRTAVVRMIIGGVDVADTEFNTPANFGTCTGASDTPATFDFCVFHPTGGGATHTNAPADFMSASGGNTVGTWFFNMENEIFEVGTTGATAGTPEANTVEMIAFLPGITQTLCNRINGELGLPATIPQETGIDIPTQMTNGIGICNGGCGATIGQDEAALDGQPYGCFQIDTWTSPTDGATADAYVYYHVLVER